MSVSSLDSTKVQVGVPPVALADVLAAAVLGLLIVEHPAQLSVAELARHFSDPLTPVPGEEVSDALADLVGDGLVHRSGEFYFATRAAVRAEYFRG